MVTLRFVSHPGWFDWATRIAQYGFWCSHCEAILPDGQTLGSRFVDGGQIRSRDYDAGGFSEELLIPLETSAAQETAFFDFLHGQIGKSYDAAAI